MLKLERDVQSIRRHHTRWEHQECWVDQEDIYQVSGKNKHTWHVPVWLVDTVTIVFEEGGRWSHIDVKLQSIE